MTDAIDLAERGWNVFPCWPDGNAARPDRAKSPIGSLVPRGHLQATRDPALIVNWWTRHPDAMIGGRVPDDMFVCDIDPRHGGTLQRLEDAAECSMPATLTAWSGRDDGGRHLYFWRPVGDLKVTRLPGGIDLKDGGKGYCILPPSIHPSTGRPYRWESHSIAEPPPGLVDLLRIPRVPRVPRGTSKNSTQFRRTGVDSDGADLVRWLARQTEGNRNEGLYWVTWKAAQRGCLTDDLERQFADVAISAGLDARAVNRTIESGRNRP